MRRERDGILKRFGPEEKGPSAALEEGLGRAAHVHLREDTRAFLIKRVGLRSRRAWLR